MKPITASTHVDAPVDEVFEYLKQLGNHESFTNHVLTDWELEGPARGVGAKAHVHTTGLGPSEDEQIEIVDVDEHDWHLTKRAEGAHGERVTTGEYSLFPRLIVGRANQRALDRLSAQYGGATA